MWYEQWQEAVSYGGLRSDDRQRRLLAKHVPAKDGYLDWFSVTVAVPAQEAERVHVRGFTDAFFNSPMFQPEKVLLSVSSVFLGKAPPKAATPASGEQAVLDPTTYGSGIFQVLEETKEEIILDTGGGVMTWLSARAVPTTTAAVAAAESADDGSSKPPTAVVELQMGSILSPQATNSPMMKAMMGFHMWYSRLLLTSASRKFIKSLKSAT